MFSSKKSTNRQADVAGAKLRGPYKYAIWNRENSTPSADSALSSPAPPPQSTTPISQRDMMTSTIHYKDAVPHAPQSSIPTTRDISASAPHPSSHPSAASGYEQKPNSHQQQQHPSYNPMSSPPPVSSSPPPPTQPKRSSFHSITSRISAIANNTSRSSFDRSSSIDINHNADASALASSARDPSLESLVSAKPSTSADSLRREDPPIRDLHRRLPSDSHSLHDRIVSKPTVPTVRTLSASASAGPATAIPSDNESSSQTRALRRMKANSSIGARGASSNDMSIPMSREDELLYGSAEVLVRSPTIRQAERNPRVSGHGTHSRSQSENIHALRLDTGVEQAQPAVQPILSPRNSIAQSTVGLSLSRAPSTSNQRSAMSSSTQPLHPQLARLKETTVPQLMSPALSNASSSRYSAILSPVSDTSFSTVSHRNSWAPTSNGSRSTPAPEDFYEMRAGTPPVIPPRAPGSEQTRSESKHYYDVPSSPIPGSPASTYVTALGSTVGPQHSSSVGTSSSHSTILGPIQSPVIRPGSAQVQALFSPSSVTSRQPTPHPNRHNLPISKQSSLQSITSVASTGSNTSVPESIPPPLPPLSTRPEQQNQRPILSSNGYSHVGPATTTQPQTDLQYQLMDQLRTTKSPLNPETGILHQTESLAKSKRPVLGLDVGHTKQQASVLRDYGFEQTESASVAGSPTSLPKLISQMPAERLDGNGQEEYSVLHESTSVVQVTTKTVRVQSSSAVRTVASPAPTGREEDHARITTLHSPQLTTQQHHLHWNTIDAPNPPPAKTSSHHNFLHRFRPNSPQRSNSNSPAVSSMAPMLMASAGVSFPNRTTPSPSPRPRTPERSRQGGGILPFRLFHKPKKSISAASVEAVIEAVPEGAMSSCSSLHTSEVGAPPSPPLRDPVDAVQEWRAKEEDQYRKSGRVKRRTPGVTFELPPGHHGPSGGEEETHRRPIRRLRTEYDSDDTKDVVYYDC